MFDDPSAEDVRSLLQSVEADTTRTSTNRDKIRGSVLATFDAATFAPEENEAEVVKLVQSDKESLQSAWSRRAVGWAAAAAAAFAAAILLLPDDGTLVETAAPPISAISSMDATDVPALLPPGPQRADMLGGGVSFSAPEGLVVLVANDGLLILALADDPDGSSGQLVFVELALSDWEGRLRELAEAGEVRLKEVGLMVNGSATTRLDVTITNEALAARSCAAGEPCMNLEGGPAADPAALWAGSDNRIVEIGRTADSMVLAIEVSQQFQGRLSQLAAEVVSTASLSTE